MRFFQTLPTALNGSVAALSLAASGWVMASAPEAAASPSAKPNAQGGIQVGAPVSAQPSAKVVARMKANGSGVVVNATVPPKLAAGQTVALRLSFDGVSAEGASAEVREPGANGRVLLTLQLPAGQPTNADLNYQVGGDGVQFIDIITRQNGRTSIQQLALAVGSGQNKLKANGTEVVTPSGERIISLPAGK